MMTNTKIMKNLFIACLGCLSLNVGIVRAQSGGTGNMTLEISLETAIQTALDENPTIHIADLEIERQKYVRKETVGNYLPSLSVGGQYSRAIVKNKIAGDVSFEPDNTISMQANLIVPLFAPGVYKTLKLNDEQMRAAVEAARGSKITLVNEVKKAYYNILLAEESLSVLRASERTVSETVEETRTKYENELASEYDYITANVQLSNLRPNIIQTENSIETAKKLLKMYMGLPLDINIGITGNLYDLSQEDKNLSYGLRDIESNSDLKSMDIQMDILEQQLKVAKTQRMPTVSAFGTLQVTGMDRITFPGFDSGPSSSFRWQNPFSAGIQFSIPIFSGLTNTRREKQIKNNISQLKLQRDYLAESTEVQLTNAVSALTTAEAMMLANGVTINQAQKGYDISRVRYDAGVGTILEVNTAELSLTQAKLNYTQSIYDYLSALADYEKIIGIEE